MERNKEIQDIFEIGDDSLQGVLGYHLYVTAMYKATNKNLLRDQLPDGLIPHTHSWNRFYTKEDLMEKMESIFELYQSRITLIAMVNVFEVVLKRFIRALNEGGHQQFLKNKKLNGKDGYKTHIKWAFQIASSCNIGDQEAIARVPFTIGKIDDARRLRNLIVHNHGLYSAFYENDAINLNGIEVQFNPGYNKFKKNPSQSIPIEITKSDIIDFSKSHIEIIHIIHNTLQKQYYQINQAYDYRKEGKRIEWNKVLWGIQEPIMP